jgi:hypothetical protein
MLSNNNVQLLMYLCGWKLETHTYNETVAPGQVAHFYEATNSNAPGRLFVFCVTEVKFPDLPSKPPAVFTGRVYELDTVARAPQANGSLDTVANAKAIVFREDEMTRVERILFQALREGSRCNFFTDSVEFLICELYHATKFIGTNLMDDPKYFSEKLLAQYTEALKLEPIWDRL